MDNVRGKNKTIMQNIEEKQNIHITRINIDSRHRIKETKNNISGSIYYLLPDPLTIYASETDCEMIIKHNSHSFNIFDNIILQGTESMQIILETGITFFNNSRFAKINHNNHNLNFNTTNDMYICFWF
jgi:hypothetical protein